MKKVLVIDDDMSYRDVVLPYLQSYGLAVSEAATISEGLKIINRMQFDLLIVDGILPDGQGIDAIKTIRDSGNNVPIVFISGVVKDPSTGNRLKSQFGVALVKAKPIVPDKLCREIMEILDKSSAVEAPRRTGPTAPSFFKKETRANISGTPLLPPSAQSSTNQSNGQRQTLQSAGQPESTQVWGPNRDTVRLKLEAVQREYLRSLPKMLGQVRERVEFAMRAPEAVDFHDLAMQVHNLKGTAGMHGRPEVSSLMQELENYLAAITAKTENLSEEALHNFALELRKCEKS
jgi:DNA-binding response OmpR family regulator